MWFARTAVFVVFGLNGFAYGTWAPRVPALADQVGAQVGALGLALLGASVGMVIAASVTGRICAAVGARAVVLASVIACYAVLPVLGLVESPFALGIVLCGLGMGIGALDVSMNVAGVTVGRMLDRPMMPVFHAGFSFGGLFGAAGAAGAAWLRLPPLQHFLIITAVGILVVLLLIRFVPNEAGAGQPALAAASSGPAPIRRPVLWLLAAVALCSAIAEGTSADWSALFLVTERGVSEGSAAIAYGAFSIAMAIARLFGERMERRFGSTRLVVLASATAAAGLLCAALIAHPAAGYLGFILAGGGLAYSFPVALGLAGAAGQRADGGGGEREIGLVTTIAYSGFLTGPPLIGMLAHVSSLAVAVGTAGLIAALIVPAVLGARAARRAERAHIVEPVH
ncbi:MFS transporter [Tamaricihabitans halophyticus]|uniref:MFS transporter n=1 Tax=Tamaricihabitans halophyticus TaxID=1262583 RepID=A0A4R2QH11_9PSEU|nr:MFS transporter [Tamaricihabitans halophyticus]TCP48532.1 MFS transporter [Tamaricihabitans halophyticus]